MDSHSKTDDADERWYLWANEESCAVRDALPPSLKEKTAHLIVTLDAKPLPDEEQQEGDSDELLGLFVGPTISEEPDAPEPLPPAIRLFIENLRDEAENDPERFRQEVRTTLLHELGHFLGLDEDGLEARGLA